MKKSSSIKFSCLKKPSETWTAGLQALLTHLHSEGYSAESGVFQNGKFVPCKAQNYSKKLWNGLEFAKSFDSIIVAKNSYSFLSAGFKAPESFPKFDLLFVDEKHAGDIPADVFCVRCSHVQAAFDCVLRALWLSEWVAKSPKRIGEKTKVGKGTIIEVGAIVGPYCSIGKNVVIESGVRIGAYVNIGDNTRIGASSRVADHSVIGAHCTLQSHVSVGTAGFGVLKGPESAYPFERIHLGRAIIGDHVRLGAFSAVDRGVYSDTVFKSFGITDNFVHIAHNCQVEEGALMCAFVGLGGSVKVGQNVTIAGFTGTTDHIEIGDNVTIGAQSGISRNVKSDQVVKGYPPRPLRESLKISALVDRLPDLYVRIKKLEGNQK